MGFSSTGRRVKAAWVIAGVAGLALVGGASAAIAVTGHGHQGAARHPGATAAAAPAAVPSVTPTVAGPVPSVTPSVPGPVPSVTPTVPGPVPSPTRRVSAPSDGPR
jgi:hypothetical protein